MKCPKCGYEDMVFSPPANVECPECDYRYEYKKKGVEKYMIKKGLITLYVGRYVVIFVNKEGGIHQGYGTYFVNDTPIWVPLLL